jgi:hypothetical protein
MVMIFYGWSLIFGTAFAGINAEAEWVQTVDKVKTVKARALWEVFYRSGPSLVFRNPAKANLTIGMCFGKGSNDHSVPSLGQGTQKKSGRRIQQCQEEIKQDQWEWEQ